MSALSPLFSRNRRSKSAPTADAPGFAAAPDARDRAGAPLQGTFAMRRRSKAKRRLFLTVTMAGLGYATYVNPAIWPKAWEIVSPLAARLIDATMTAVATQTGPELATPPTKPNNGGKLHEAALNQSDTQQLPDTASASKPEDGLTPSPAPAQVLPTNAAAASVAASAAGSVTASTPRPSAIIISKALPSQTPPAAITAEPEQPASSATGIADATRIADIRQALTDPLQKRAADAGLHPDVSRAILLRLSNADFKAAETAIRKALSELEAGSVLVWPQKPTKTAAMFHVSFIPSASPDCRRYIVAIAKDGWQTTALPVEKCFTNAPASRAG